MRCTPFSIQCCLVQCRCRPLPLRYVCPYLVVLDLRGPSLTLPFPLLTCWVRCRAIPYCQSEAVGTLFYLVLLPSSPKSPKVLFRSRGRVVRIAPRKHNGSSEHRRDVLETHSMRRELVETHCAVLYCIVLIVQYKCKVTEQGGKRLRLYKIGKEDGVLHPRKSTGIAAVFFSFFCLFLYINNADSTQIVPRGGIGTSFTPPPPPVGHLSL